MLFDNSLFLHFLFAMAYAYPAALGILNFKKFRDWPSLSLVPSFSWVALYLTISPYAPEELSELWGRLAFIVLSISIVITMAWRYSMLRGHKWIR